jgi:hypothetical protein
VRHAVFVLALSAGAAAAAPPVELTLTPRALSEAIDIGQSRIDAVRLRFHEPYRILVSRAPVDYVDVVTPFRRVALAAEGRARLGDRLFGQREARAVLGTTPDQIDLLVELTFHPQNTYVGVPAYAVRLLALAGTVAAVEPRSVTRVPRFGPRMEGSPLLYPFPLTPPVAPGSLPLTGGTLVVALAGDAVDPKGTYELLVIEAGKELAKARIDLAGLR